jgi:hypothetical protein
MQVEVGVYVIGRKREGRLTEYVKAADASWPPCLRISCDN